ncbi:MULTISPECIES: hypothetical protein [Flavobacterium]|uniref:Uncharacterized protein n=1 Tax=Flavobacterium jumunjinense TaxID=998845 RepID=A0ABV5GKU5_9FLAO|nr:MULTISPECIES: hypothetical protein [Flavobacterium]
MQKETEFISKEISTLLHKLEVAFWEVHVYPGNFDGNDYYEDENGQIQYYPIMKEMIKKLGYFMELELFILKYVYFLN